MHLNPHTDETIHIQGLGHVEEDRVLSNSLDKRLILER